jgi:hypothetical protein
MTGLTTRFLVRGWRGRAVARCALVLVAVAGAVAGCTTSPPQAESMRDPQSDFAAYRTFGWTSGATVDGTDAPLKLLDSNLRAAIAAELQRRGYTAAAAGTVPDLRITYETASEQKLENNPVRVGIGVGSWGGNIGGSVNVGSPSVRNYQEGTLVVHAIDTARNAEVWQGRVSKKITKGSTEPAAVAQAVAVAMQDFPRK